MDTLEHTARQIAEHGRDALLERLRPAFEEAAAAHADVLQLDSEQLESMVQRAADRADALQWRRALATVAAQQLGLELGDALEHPAVVRAQEIVGAPSYEDSLAELTAGASGAARTDRERGGADVARADQEGEGLDVVRPVRVGGPAVEARAGREREWAGPARTPYEGKQGGNAPVDRDRDRDRDRDPGRERGDGADDLAPRASSPLVRAIRLPAIHLEGIANLAPAESGLALRFSDHGLQIFRGESKSPLGRVALDDISALEVSNGRGGSRRRRRRQGTAAAELVVRTGQGEASFEIPGLGADELSTRLAPLRERIGK